MAELTPAQRMAAEAMINRTFESVGAPPSYIQPQQSVAEMYKGIYPPASATAATAGTKYLTPAQKAQIGAVPANSYQTPKALPLTAAGTAYGSQYPNTGNKGKASGSMLELISLPPNQRPAWTVPTAQPVAQVPLPRPRPGFAPTTLDMAAINAPVGARPGIGGALLGNGVMAPGIAPQGPPPPGIAPTVWAGESGGSSAAPVPRPSPAHVGTNGYIYQNGVNIGSARAPGITAAQQYEAANLMGQVNALNRQAAARAAGLMTPVEKLQANGMSASQAYAAANSGPGSVSAMEAKHSGYVRSDPTSAGTFGSRW